MHCISLGCSGNDQVNHYRCSVLKRESSTRHKQQAGVARYWELIRKSRSSLVLWAHFSSRTDDQSIVLIPVLRRRVRGARWTLLRSRSRKQDPSQGVGEGRRGSPSSYEETRFPFVLSFAFFHFWQRKISFVYTLSLVIHINYLATAHEHQADTTSPRTAGFFYSFLPIEIRTNQGYKASLPP